jgi:quercetin dioxygenase-like cupin family protein
LKETKNGGWKPVIILGLMVLCIGVISIPAGDAQTPLTPKVIPIDVSGKDDLQLLGGPPDTVTMRSGRVILAPGKSVGKHTTGANEEVLVILEGQGEMRITGGETLSLNRSVVAYCPPHREHDVLNTGTGPLRYVYIVAKAQ